MVEGGDKNQTFRWAEIIRLLKDDSTLNISALSKILGVSVVTIRKDLDRLEKEGLLSRVHGGAIVKNTAVYYGSDLKRRMHIKAEEKKNIAKAVASLVNDGDSIIINVGSTCAYVYEQIKNKKNLIVITNALHLLNDLSICPNITTFFLGGRFDHGMQITIGDDVIDQLSKYKADKLIMGMDGIDIKNGATTYNHVEDFIMRQMIAQAKEKILVADDSKIGKMAFAFIADIKEFDILVTNRSESNSAILREIEKTGLKVIIV